MTRRNTFCLYMETHPANTPATHSATRIPSIPADMIPPANPAPSPAGNNPFVFALCPSRPRTIRSGDDVRVSTPVNIASGISNPTI